MRKDIQYRPEVRQIFNRKLPYEAVALFSAIYNYTDNIDVAMVSQGEFCALQAAILSTRPCVLFLDDINGFPLGPAFHEERLLANLTRQIKRAMILSGELYFDPIAQAVASSVREMPCMIVQTTRANEIDWANWLSDLNPAICIELWPEQGMRVGQPFRRS
jgi:hypothetical protein